MYAPSENVLTIVSLACIIPLTRPLDRWPKETLTHLIDNIEKRFSDDGRMEYSRAVCRNLDKFGYRIPEIPKNPSGDGYLQESFCIEHVLNTDYETYTDDMVQETIEYLDACIHPKQNPEQAPVMA